MNTSTLLCMLAALSTSRMLSNADIALPSYFKTCSRNDPTFKECATRTGQSIISQIANGEPALDIDSMDPMDLGNIDLQVAELTLALSDVKTYGWANAILKDFDVNFTMQQISIDLELPKGVILGNYIVGGKLADLDMASVGQFNVTMDDVDLSFTIPYQLVTRDNGIRYMVLGKPSNADMDVSNASIYLDNLFGGDEDLGDLVNAYLNANWKELMEKLSPDLKEVNSYVMGAVLKFMERIPFDELFPSN